MNKFIAIAFALFYLGCPTLILSQTYGDVGLSLNSPIEIQPDTDYEIGSIQIKGADQLDPTMVSLLSGLNVGDKVQFPSDKVAKAVRNLWEQELFDDVQLYITKKMERVVYLEFRLKTLPKLSKFYFTGIKKAKQDAIRELLDLKRGKVVSKNLLITSSNAIKKYFIEKGFLEADAKITSFQDSSLLDAVILKIDVNPGERLKIEEIVFKGNKSISDKKLRKVMDDTHRYRWWNIFGISKLLKEKLESDKSLIVEAYNEAGFRDMRIKSDTFYKTPENKLIIEF